MLRLIGQGVCTLFSLLCCIVKWLQMGMPSLKGLLPYVLHCKTGSNMKAQLRGAADAMCDLCNLSWWLMRENGMCSTICLLYFLYTSLCLAFIFNLVWRNHIWGAFNWILNVCFFIAGAFSWCVLLTLLICTATDFMFVIFFVQHCISNCDYNGFTRTINPIFLHQFFLPLQVAQYQSKWYPGVCHTL